ncbi:MAG: aromatic ring-hydroxylating oxygenase subunit alpha [Arenicellales bacterium WSBS_2016_MAG_OTU3]
MNTDFFAGRPISSDVLNKIKQPTAAANGLPNLAYTNAEFALYERDYVLAKTWICLGFASDVPNMGDVYPADIMGLPLVMVRDKNGNVNVFHNVCSHRGQMLVHKACNVKSVIRCPYHSWTYKLEGELQGTPHIGGSGIHELEGFEKDDKGLKSVRSGVWSDLVFINLSGDAESFEDYLKPLRERWQPFWGDSEGINLTADKTTGYTELRLNANWKLAVENYCEAYHLPWVHPDLNRYSKLEDHYNIAHENHFAGQGTTVYNADYVDGPAFPKFPHWPADKKSFGEYAALFPNVLLGIQVDHVFAMILMPDSAEQTTERLQLYYLDDAAISETHATTRDSTRKAWRQVFAEDVWAVEGMQRGRQSPAFNGGTFSSVMDVPTHTFHKWLAERLE